jgi:hypothetical protein
MASRGRRRASETPSPDAGTRGGPVTRKVEHRYPTSPTAPRRARLAAARAVGYPISYR